MQISESKRHFILELIKNDFVISESVISKINNETSQMYYRGRKITIQEVEEFCVWWFYEEKSGFHIEIFDDKEVCDANFLIFLIYFFLYF